MNEPYGTDEGANAYFEARGDEAWAALPEAKRRAARVRASDYIRNAYVRPIPIANPYTSPEVEEGTYIAAGIEAATPGFFSATYASGAAKILTEVKGIKWTPVSGGEAGGGGLEPRSLAIDALFSGMETRGIGVIVV